MVEREEERKVEREGCLKRSFSSDLSLTVEFQV